MREVSLGSLSFVAASLPRSHAPTPSPRVKGKAAESHPCLNPAQPDPAPAQPLVIRLPILADLTLRADGTYTLRPLLPACGETWVTVKQAAKILGSCVSARSIYGHLGVYLVYRRPIKQKIEIKLASIMAFRRAADDPEFWEDEALRLRLQRAVMQEMNALISGSSDTPPGRP